jgi:dTDP-4-amino-4,6-dideoxygalactose transaminase
MLTASQHIVPTPALLQQTEEKIKQEFLAKDILWTGRAATALLFAYRAILATRPEIKEPEVILTGLSCGTLANASMMSGVRPRFADVDKDTALITLDSIKKVYDPAKTIAVIFIHLYGNTADIEPIRDWCHANGLYFIEDVVQALGGKLPNGKKAGSIGDATLMGFNKTKILECGGGALLIKNEELRKQFDGLKDSAYPWTVPAKELKEQLALSYRNFHHSMVTLLRLRQLDDISRFFLKVRKSYEPLYFQPDVNPEKIAEAFTQLDGILERRQKKADLYTSLLKDGPWQIMDNGRTSGCCWRFSVLFDKPESVYSFSEAVRKDGFHVSNLYWPVNQFFNPDDECPSADHIGRRIINLWVDDSVSEEYVRSCAESMLRNSHKFSDAVAMV